ncbi:MAG: polysaccharide biosynthesis/export family protein [Planctomycetaceae bacterium]|nr:polysaccharide biosynthesis/export family protein [Planctomycetaceae bacterium]
MSHFKHLHLLMCTLLVIPFAGCASSQVVNDELALVNYSGIPRELDKATLPAYRIEPPDILLVEAVNNIRTENVNLSVGDTLQIELGNPAPLQISSDQPGVANLSPVEQMQNQYEFEQEVRNKYVNGPFVIQPDGTVQLGPVYGSVKVEGLTLDGARQAIENHLETYTTDVEGNPAGLKSPQVVVSLPDLAGKQVIAGEHLVRPDGSISLGIYGSVYVTGMTLQQAKRAIEQHLSQHIHKPEVSVDVLAYNSKSIYVITDGGGFGEQVAKLPVTGNETVLDAISEIEGLSSVSSKKIWIARPAPAGVDQAQILDVHWSAITQEGITTTNYQLFPGDRIYIEADKLVKTDNVIAKLLAPAERVLGFIALGTGVARSIEFYDQQGAGFGGGGF